MKEREETAPRVFAYVDVETTGMKPFVDRVIDIAVIRVEDGIVTKTISTLVNPSRALSFSITAISGITDDMLVSAPQFDDIAIELAEILNGAVFVAHNAHFDYNFIKNEFRRIGMQFRMPMLCTVKLSRSLFPGERSHDLDALIARHGIDCAERHRAYPDADVLRQWMERLPKMVGVEAFEGAISSQLAAATLPPLLHRSVLARLPDTPGIYFFYSKDRELLYVGKSKNIRTRVRSHFSNTASRSEQRLCSQTAFVESTETAGELSALLLEAQTIKTHMPLYNRTLRRARTMVVAIQETTEYGYFQLQLVQCATLPAGATVAAMFRTMTQAKSALRTIAKEHRLCPKLLGIESSKSRCFNSQLGQCDGACVGKEAASEYNTRFGNAFLHRMIKSWPFRGPIVIEERDSADTGAAFFVDKWQLLKSVSYDTGGVSEFLTESAFDYDTYKILARYIFDQKNRRNIRTLSPAELRRSLQHISQNDEAMVEYV